MAVGDLRSTLELVDSDGNPTGIILPVFEVSDSVVLTGKNANCFKASTGFPQNQTTYDIISQFMNQSEIRNIMIDLGLITIYTSKNNPRFEFSYSPYVDSLGFAFIKSDGSFIAGGTRYEGNRVFFPVAYQPATNRISASVIQFDNDEHSSVYTWQMRPYSPTSFDDELPTIIAPPQIDAIQIDPSKYSLTFGQSNVYNIHGYKDGQLVEGIEFEVGPLPEEARGVTLIYPFDGDYTKCRIKMPYISDGVVPDDFEVPVQYGGIVRTFKVVFYGHGDAYTPGGSIGGGSGIPSGSGGGGGTFPSSPGPSLVDKIPSGQTGNDIAKSGMFTMYLMNQQYMDLMGDIFWEDNLGIAVLKEIFGNPIDSVISTTSYPFNLVNLASSANQNLFFGPWNTGLPFIALTKSSFQIDWGTIEIPFAWGNFLDYSPYTKMELFLPWGPGYVTIDPNDVSPYSNTPGNFNVSTFSSGSIQVKTNIELGKGTCVHNVIGNNGRVIGSYSGIVGKQVPLTALDTGGKALTTIGAVAGLVGGAAVGSLAAKGALDTGRMTAKPVQDPMRPFESSSYWDIGAISGRSTAQSMVSTGANLASRAISSTPITFPRAGTFSDGSSAMTVQEPFLIISRPVQSVPTQYGHYNGYPSNIHVANLNAVSGYTELAEIHLDNVTATADELQELDAILKGGILL